MSLSCKVTIYIFNYLEYTEINRNFVDSHKLLYEKNEEIENLKKCIQNLEKNNSIIMENNNSMIKSPNKKINSSVYESPTPHSFITKLYHNPKKQEDSEYTKSIMNINKRVLDDLDALYFIDKVNMRSNSNTNSNGIPKLDFNFNNKNIYTVNKIINK